MYADLLRMENAVKASDLDWTILRPPRLLNEPRTGHYHVAINGHLTRGVSIPRGDVADFIVTHLTDSATYFTTVELAKLRGDNVTRRPMLSASALDYARKHARRPPRKAPLGGMRQLSD